MKQVKDQNVFRSEWDKFMEDDTIDIGLKFFYRMNIDKILSKYYSNSDFEKESVKKEIEEIFNEYKIINDSFINTKANLMDYIDWITKRGFKRKNFFKILTFSTGNNQTLWYREKDTLSKIFSGLFVYAFFYLITYFQFNRIELLPLECTLAFSFIIFISQKISFYIAQNSWDYSSNNLKRSIESHFIYFFIFILIIIYIFDIISQIIDNDNVIGIILISISYLLNILILYSSRSIYYSVFFPDISNYIYENQILLEIYSLIISINNIECEFKNLHKEFNHLISLLKDRIIITEVIDTVEGLELISSGIKIDNIDEIQDSFIAFLYDGDEVKIKEFCENLKKKFVLKFDTKDLIKYNFIITVINTIETSLNLKFKLKVIPEGKRKKEIIKSIKEYLKKYILIIIILLVVGLILYFVPKNYLLYNIIQFIFSKI